MASLLSSIRQSEEKVARGVGLEKSRLELAAQIDSVRRELSDLERRLAEARKEKTAAEAHREKVRAECAAEEQARSTRVRALQRDMDLLAQQAQTIGAYVQDGKDEARHASASALAATQREIDEVQRNISQIKVAAEKLDEKTRNFEGLRRDLHENVDFQRGLAAERSLASELEEKTQQAAAIGVHAALKAELDQVEGEAARIRNDQNKLRGRMETYKEQVEKCRRELRDGSFKDIEARYRQANIELRTTEMANDDLNKYHAALDKALMSFHASKMAEINKVVKELWQKTYRNPDIDHIAIVSDGEAGDASRRNYNYRVVMKNREEELDMRGRCSAGQKVLACLIIRLALAETFCLNCGILALDEPTTNLDAANSASLAQALTDIMNSRREQESFQLIVITHDIKFAHMLGQREHADYYWRISKDDQLHSHIEMEQIDEGA